MHNMRSSIFHDIYNQPYNENTRRKLYISTKASLELTQRMSLLKRLYIHNGCVNSICWNSNGELILSGSDDQHLVLTNAYNYQVLTDYKTSHRANIFSAKFLPNSGDHRIVSCSGDGIILYTDLMRRTETFHNQFTCHRGTTYEIATIQGEPYSFLSCGEDGTVRLFDLRVKEKCDARCYDDVLLFCRGAVTALSVNPMMPHQIAIGCSDSTVQIWDRRILRTTAANNGWINVKPRERPLCTFTVPEFEGNAYRITSLSYSPDGQDVLVSYSSDHLYLFSMKDQGSIQLKKGSTSTKGKGKKQLLRSPQPVRRLRLRGDWSDTGPDARPEREGGRRGMATEISQARPVLHTSLMQRMTDVLSRMLNDPATRAALSGGGEDSLEGIEQHATASQQNIENGVEDRDSIEVVTSTNETENEDGSENERDQDPVTENNDSNKQDRSKRNEEGGDNLEQNDVVLVTANNTSIREEENIPMEVITPTHSEGQNASIQSLTSLSISQTNTTEEHSRNNVATSRSDIGNSNSGNIMENLQDQLTTMRDGFLERHGSEPAVSLTYSDKSSTSATISLGVADEISRDSYHAGPSGVRSTNRDIADPGPSNTSSRSSYHNLHENTDEDVYNDSDDEDMESAKRFVSPIESNIDEVIDDVRTLQDSGVYDESSCSMEYGVKQKYMGHRNARTMIKEANFWGDDYVMSGSDCGHIFIWKRDTAKLCMLLEADQHVVNCLQPHPYLPILATSGIDYDVKLWAPVSPEPIFDENFAEDLKKRNAVMLEETKDTITVPAVFMIRMLACLNQIRRGRGRNRRRSNERG